MRAALAMAALLVPAAAAGQSVLQTRHNLSVTGPGTIKATSETQVCVFCHVPHGGPIPGSTATYRPYASSTLTSPAPGQPNGATRSCLSCHDGTIAMPRAFSGAPPLQGAASLGVDLRRSHPVSFTPAPSGRLRDPPEGDPVKLDALGRLQCTSCHDPHRDLVDPVEGKFLVKDNRSSALCTTCHVLVEWQSNPSAHQASNTPWDAARGAHTAYATVGQNGCEACHRPHGAATTSRLLDPPQPQVCLVCHDGLVAVKDVRADALKPFVHPVLSGDPALHDPSEGPASAAFPLPETAPGSPRHAQCTDCHEPHAAYARAAFAPLASGPLAGVWGIDRAGNAVLPVRNEYEVCFKCHADSANQPQRLGPTPPETVRRAVVDPNLRRRFDLSAPSFHPVEGPGRSTVVPGLASGLTPASMIYCSDCHASDAGPGAGGQGPRGPHGSIYPHILERGFTTADPSAESPVAYALCYKCHQRDVLLSDASAFKSHARHVVQEMIPCSVCHDWHGVSALQGDPIHNAHLVDFDVSVVGLNARGVREYVSQGPQHGTCSVRCHGSDHDARAY